MAFATGGVTATGVQSQILATGSVAWDGPVGVATDSTGNIYIAQCSGDQIVKIDATTHATTVLSLGSYSVRNPQQLAIDSNNNLYIADQLDDRIVVYSITNSAVTATYPVSDPFAVALDASKNIWVGSNSNGNIYEIPVSSISGTAATIIIAGTSTNFANIWGISFDADGNMWVSNNPTPNSPGQATGTIAEFTKTSSFTTMNTVFNSSTLNGPGQILFDSSNNMYVAEDNINSVVKFNYSSGYTYGYSATDYEVISNSLEDAEAITQDSNGNFFLTAYGGGELANSKVIEISTSVASFGSQAVNTTSPAVSFNFHVQSGTTIGSFAVLDQGFSGLEFNQVVNLSTDCATGLYNSATACSIQATFTPKYPGERLGAVEVLDNSSNVLATALVSGIGTGPEITYATLSSGSYLPLSQNMLAAPSGGFSQPTGVAMDGAGNVFVADWGNSAVYEIPAAGGATRQLGGTLYNATGVAVDWAGNVYVAQGTQGVTEIEAVNGSIPASPTIKSLGSRYGDGRFYYPTGVAVDGSGNVFVADEGTGSGYYQAVFEIVAVNGSVSSSSTLRTLGSGFKMPCSVVVDGSGNVFVADQDVDGHFHGNVYEIEAVNGSIPTTNPTIKTLGSGFSKPTGVAVDAAGNVFVGDQSYSGGAVNEILAVNGSVSSSSTVIELGSIVGGALAVAGNGNVFVAAPGSSAVYELDYADAPTLSYTKPTVVGTTDAIDGTMSLLVQNIGNETLTISGLAKPTDFAQESASGTPPDCAVSGTVAAGASCNLSINFAPTLGTTPGLLSEAFTLTDNNLNATTGPGTQQSITLSGTATAPITFIFPSSETLNAGTVGTSFSQTVTASGGTSPYAYTASSESLPAGLTLSSAGILSGTPTTAGSSYSFTVTATDRYSNTGSQTYTLVISKATPTVPPSAWPTASAITYGQTLASSTLSGGEGSVPGSFAFTTPATAPGVGTASQSVTFKPTDSADYSSVTGTVSVTVLDFSLTAGSGSGSSGTTQTASPGGTATYTLALLPSAGTILPAPVTLTVSGMPAGATATITPSAWTQLTSTSWSFPANTALTAISLSIQLPSTMSSLNQKDLPRHKLPLAFLSILLLPFAGKMRRTGKKLSRMLWMLLLLIAGMTAMAGLSGCGSGTEFFSQAQKSYTVTATATSGTLKSSTTITLTVE
jgi:hypothetical protein